MNGTHSEEPVIKGIRQLWALIALVALPATLPAQVMRFSTGAFGGGIALTGGNTNTKNDIILDGAPSGYGVTGWKTGQWARYNINRALNPQFSIEQFRLVSVVGQDGGKYWVEVQDDMMTPQRQTMPIRKLLLPFGAVDDARMSEELILQRDSSIRRTTIVRPPKAEEEKKPFPSGWTKVGDEDVTTPAGTFHSTHWKMGSDELWVSSQAGPIGVVKYQGNDTKVELVARSDTGAKSRIPGGGR